MTQVFESVRSLSQLARLVLLAFGRLAYLARLRSAQVARRCSVTRLDDYEPMAWNHRIHTGEVTADLRGLPEDRREEILTHTERALHSEHRLYGWLWVKTAQPPRWHVNLVTGAQYPWLHPSRIGDNPKRGNIKDVWELSRLLFTFVLARAYALPTRNFAGAAFRPQQTEPWQKTGWCSTQ